MRILCTGGAGFVGRHVVRRLVSLGHTVTVVDCLDQRVHPSETPPAFPEGVEFLRCQVDAIPYSAMREQDRVIHLAAQVSVADSVTDFRRYVDHNTYQTAVFLEDLRRNPDLTRVVVASSMSVYGAGGLRVQETAPVNPASVYGLTKYDQEQMCLLWGEHRRVPVVALRYFNIYGPEQALHNGYTGVLANFANKLLANEPPIVYEDGGQTRDFICVDDVVDATVHACLSDTKVHGVFNICTGEPTTVLMAAKLLAKALGRDYLEPRVTNTQRPGDIRHCTGSPVKALSQLGWASLIPFEHGIRRYGQWLMS